MIPVETLTQDALDDFEAITKFDISSFFTDYSSFATTDYNKIVNYYNGATITVPADSFSKLKDLTKRGTQAIEVTIGNNSSLDNYKFWIVLEYIENVNSFLETCNNLSRWCRSAVTGAGYQRDVLVDKMLSQGQTLENFEAAVVGSDDPQETWIDTALQNQMKEEDYDLSGGQLMKITYKGGGLWLQGVVDNMDSSLKVYGLDLDRQIGWSNDDLNILSYTDTLLQSVDILATLKQGDDPDFPARGINAKIGGNIAGITYPIIFRSLAASFATDDSLQEFSITDISKIQDAIFINYTVKTKTGDFFSSKAQLSGRILTEPGGFILTEDFKFIEKG